MSIIKNNTLTTNIASVASATTERVFSSSSLNIAVAAGDYLEIITTTPTWATDPGSTTFAGYLYID
jgi:hypothetical protein